MKAFIFAAGKGTRLKPFTDKHPKALAKVNNITLLERNIRFLQSFGINDFIINIHHFGEQIVDFLKENDNFGAKIEISDESEELLETGGALFFAKELLRRRVEVVASTQRRTVGWRYFVFKDFFKKELCFALCVDGQPIFL